MWRKHVYSQLTSIELTLPSVSDPRGHISSLAFGTLWAPMRMHVHICVRACVSRTTACFVCAHAMSVCALGTPRTILFHFYTTSYHIFIFFMAAHSTTFDSAYPLFPFLDFRTLNGQLGAHSAYRIPPFDVGVDEHLAC